MSDEKQVFNGINEPAVISVVAFPSGEIEIIAMDIHNGVNISVTPQTAREIAAALVKSADKSEGKNATS